MYIIVIVIEMVELKKRSDFWIEKDGIKGIDIEAYIAYLEKIIGNYR